LNHSTQYFKNPQVQDVLSVEDVEDLYADNKLFR